VDQAIEQFRGYLRSRRLRLTPERMELLRAVLRSPAHFDADDLVAAMQKKGRRISRATIYRTLSLLEQSGILRKSLFGQDRGFYEPTIGHGHHDHIVCVSCGHIEEFYEKRLEQLQEQVLRDLGFEPLNHVHELFGVCPKCQDGWIEEQERS
jgi:Fur family ferric uptake transcriptional regulator